MCTRRAKLKAALARASSSMRQTNDQKTTGATDLASDGLFPFQVAKKPLSLNPPQGGSGDREALFPDRPMSRSRGPLTRPITEQALTEVDQIAMFATQLDALLASVEDDTVRTVAIHLFALFLPLNRNNHGYNVDIAKLSAQTGLSRRRVKHSLYALTLAGKIQRLHGKKPRRYRLTRGAQHETQTNTNRHT